jgi:hypothetical protein
LRTRTRRRSHTCRGESAAAIRKQTIVLRLATRPAGRRAATRRCLRKHQRGTRRRRGGRRRIRLSARHRRIQTHRDGQYRFARPQRPRIPVLLFHFILLTIHLE